MTLPIQGRIQQAARENERLLRGLAENESGPSQLKQHQALIADLDTQIQITTERVEDLKRKAAIELKDHEKYRDSHVRRWAHKASGKKERVAEKAAKEEREYFDAIQQQKSAEDELAYAKHLRAEAESQRAHCEETVRKYQAYQAELDALYNSIFAGHTPDFPDEDRKEEACNTAQRVAQHLNERLERERQALHLLNQSLAKLNDARRHLDSAYGLSQMDVLGGGTFVSMSKRNDLEKAESCLQQVRMLQTQIKQTVPDIPSLGQLNIEMGSILTDVVFDNIFSDMEMHNKIKQSIARVDSAGHKCADINKYRTQREKQLEGRAQSAQERLHQARIDLQKAREVAFRRMLEEGQAGTDPGPPASLEPPPAYSK